jgi:hypothetical protein
MKGIKMISILYELWQVILGFVLSILLLFGIYTFATNSNISISNISIEKNEISEILNLGYNNLTNDEAEFYGMMFAKYAKKYNIDWRIYPAIITIESNWDPSAVSDSGAKGVPQMMDSTFKLECKRYRISYIEKKTIQNDVILLGRGLEYLSRMVKAKGMERGVKSYIGGPYHSPNNKECQKYWIKFKAEYAKVVALSKEHKEYEAMTINNSINH